MIMLVEMQTAALSVYIKILLIVILIKWFIDRRMIDKLGTVNSVFYFVRY